MKRIALALILFFGAAVVAFAEPVILDPIAPTSVDPIHFRVASYCGAKTLGVSRAGNVIRIELEIPGILCDPAVRSAHSVRIDPLPPGFYRVEVFRQEVDAVHASADFVVRNGEAKSVVAHPFVIESGVPRPRVRIHRPDGSRICTSIDCSEKTIRVGGVAVTNPKPEPNGYAVWFTPPELPEGLADLTLQSGEAIERIPAALFFTESSAPPSIFESILFPVLDDLEGANGSHWVSEAVIANPNPWYVRNPNNIIDIHCVISPCGSEQLGPASYVPFLGRDYPHGVLLLVPRDEADALSFSLRVRDTTRAREGFGTRIPVVRERAMSRSNPLVLLDVPRDPRYRIRLRGYAIRPFGERAPRSHVRIVDAATRAETRASLDYEPPEDAPNDPTFPAYAELDLPPGKEGERSAIFVEPAWQTLTWVFATVTNNETQQVTIIVPDGAGERPCFQCREP